MYYIEPITDPKILKLGIRMALYGEKKPELKEVFDPDNKIIVPKWPHKHNKAFKEWQKSRIAYLKEPEFKVGEGVYHKGDSDNNEWNIYEIRDGYIYLRRKGIFKREKTSNLSHYYPGQEYNGDIKYVREKKVLYFRQGIYKSQWQEVEEPVKVKGNIGMKKPNPDYTQFQEGVDKGTILAEIN